MAGKTKTARLVAGAEMVNADPDIHGTRMPAMIALIRPADNGTCDAEATPKQSGKATKKTTMPAEISSDAPAKENILCCFAINVSIPRRYSCLELCIGLIFSETHYFVL